MNQGNKSLVFGTMLKTDHCSSTAETHGEVQGSRFLIVVQCHRLISGKTTGTIVIEVSFG